MRSVLLRHLFPAAAILLATATPRVLHAQDACGYLTAAQVTAAMGTPVNAGTPGPKNCVWHVTKGDGNLYLTLRDGATYDTFKSQVQALGHMTPVTGLGDDAFFLSGSKDSAPLYVHKGSLVYLIMARVAGHTLDQNQATEKAVAAQILASHP